MALLADGAAWATWIEAADGQTFFAARRVEPTGHASPVVTIAAIPGGRISGYPRVAWHAGELIFAWTEAGTVKTAVAAAPAPSTRASR